MNLYYEDRGSGYDNHFLIPWYEPITPVVIVSGRFFTMDPTGAAVWDTGISVEECVAATVKSRGVHEFDVRENIGSINTLELLLNLVGKTLAQVADGRPSCWWFAEDMENRLS